MRQMAVNGLATAGVNHRVNIRGGARAGAADLVIVLSLIRPKRR